MMSVHGSLYDLHEDFHKSPRPEASLYLDLDKTQSLKSIQNAIPVPNYPVFSTPGLALTTPDITTLLSNVESQSSSITTQAPTPNSFLRGRVTEEQEMYAKGFLDALDQLQTSPQEYGRQPASVSLPQDMIRRPAAANHHKAGSSGGPHSVIHHHLSSTMHSPIATGPNPTLEAVAPYVTATLDFIPNITSSQPEATTAFDHSSTTHNFTTNSYTRPFTNLYSGSPSAVDAFESYSGAPIGGGSAAHIMGGPAMPSHNMTELQRVVPADLHTQEQMKEERKKARNRIAASKCRLRRLQRESELQGKVRTLKERNQELNSEVGDLKEQINNLKRALIQHMKGGCHVNFPEGYVLEPSE
jgi:hypothetical protein